MACRNGLVFDLNAHKSILNAKQINVLCLYAHICLVEDKLNCTLNNHHVIDFEKDCNSRKE